MAEAELDLAAQLAAALKQRDTLKSELQTAKSRAVKRITVINVPHDLKRRGFV